MSPEVNPSPFSHPAAAAAGGAPGRHASEYSYHVLATVERRGRCALRFPEGGADHVPEFPQEVTE